MMLYEIILDAWYLRFVENLILGYCVFGPSWSSLDSNYSCWWVSLSFHNCHFLFLRLSTRKLYTCINSALAKLSAISAKKHHFNYVVPPWPLRLIYENAATTSTCTKEWYTFCEPPWHQVLIWTITIFLRKSLVFPNTCLCQMLSPSHRAFPWQTGLLC